MKWIRHILLLLLCLVGGAEMLRADDPVVVMYVSPTGKFENDGSSWAYAKNNLQNAIDVLSENSFVAKGTKKGYVYVAGSEDCGATSYSATYYPTRRSTDDADGNLVNTSFRIYGGIYVYGGFKGDEKIPNPSDPEYAYCDSIHELWKLRELSTGIVYGKLMEMHDDGELDDTRSWDFKYKSILSGNHHITNFSFTYDSKRGVYNTIFPLSSYHVVWFGTNGKIDPTSGVEEYEPIIDGEDAADDPVKEVDGVFYLLNTKANTALVTKKPNELYTDTVRIPGTITVTGDYAGEYKVTGIRNGAFARCKELVAVIMANNITSIGQAAFYGCEKLDSLLLPVTLTHIYRYAFQGCVKLTSVTFQKNIKLIDRWAFCGCTRLATADIPSTINYIGRYAFKNTALPANTVLPNYEKEEDSMTGRFKGLKRKAVVSGFTIEGGNANSTNLQGHEHTGYGGGAYLVRNARLEDCIVHHCSATQRGGGVYLDGGGDVNYCYVHTCQTPGFGMQQGYGGGICIDYDGEVEHCYVVQCAARAGAGLAICHDPNDYPEEAAVKQDSTFYDAYKDNEDIEASCYDPFAKATLIANCTSNAEGAGVYLNYGGSLDHVTVVNNECIGPDVIYYGMRHGRTGGIYVREAGAIYNSAVWGNKCGVNNDIQFAAFKKEDYFDITIDHSAFSKGDITDWASVIRNSVINLNDVNFPTDKFSSGNFPMFEHPTVSAGIMHNAGVVDTTATGRAVGQAYQDAYNWHPLGMSSMRGKGKQIVDVTVASKQELLHANADRDVLGIKFESVSVCGAITNTYHDVKFALMTSLERQEGRTDGESEPIPTLFVDPSKVATSATNTDDGKVGYQEDQALGASWKHPLNNLQDAVYFFSQALNEDKILQKYKKADLDANEHLLDNINLTKKQYADRPDSTYYLLPELNDDGTIKIVDDKIVYKKYRHVQILVKEGTMNVAGRGAYLTGHIRTASVRPTSNMRLYGGYPSTSSETTITGRNPHKFDSDVKADVTGGEFNDHSVHVFSIANHHDVIIDGFRLIGGNGNIASPPKGTENTPAAQEEWQFYNSVSNGGGLAMNNSREEFPRDMTGNILRNCVIANCAAPTGAALFVNGITDHISGEDRRVDPADESKGTMKACRAELTVVNTVIRNCTAGDTYDDPDKFLDKPGTMNITLEGVVVANGQGANIVMRNSDVVSNCGFPFMCKPINTIDTVQGCPTFNNKLSRAIAENPESEFAKAGHIQVYNSVIFSNGLRAHAERDSINSTVFCPKESWYNVSGEYIYMGYDILLPNDFIKVEGDVYDDNLKARLESKHIYRELTHKKSENNIKKELRLNNGSQQGIASGDSVRVRYPYFVNPSRNVGHSTTDDKSLYGGAISYEPLPTNPIVNAANTNVDKDGGSGLNASGQVCMKYDMGLTTRDYGGDPDIGAIETTRLLKDGAVIYVTPNGGGDFSGSSWANAIAGNTIYQVPDVEGPNLYAGDSKDEANRILDSGANPRKTTDPLYRGGFARKYEYFMFADTIYEVVASKKVVRTVYVDGPRDGESEADTVDISPIVKSPTVVPWHLNGSVPDGSSYNPEDAYDPNYPYGELSGYSRAMYRAAGNAGPIDENGNKDADITTSTKTAADVATSGQLVVRNERTEKYVSGLQYAVEEASKRNKRLHKDSVQVWVGAGKYSDYKGYIMRDSVTVKGGFPVGKYASPSESERVPLLSDSAIVPIPKSQKNLDLNAADYETILQISDTNPKKSNTEIDPKAMIFKDDSASIKWKIKIATFDTITRIETHYKTWGISSTDVSTTYIRYPDMLKGDKNVFHKDNRHKTDKTGVATAGGWSWIAGENYVYQYWGDKGGGNNSWELVYANRKNNVDYNNFKFDALRQVINAEGTVIDTVRHGMELTGGMSKMSAWQTMKNVPAGKYELQIDLAAFYRRIGPGNGYDVEDENTGVTFYILASDGDTLAKQPIFVKNTTTPYKLRRYTFTFTRSAAGDLTIRLMSAPGDKTTDPSGLNSDMPAIDKNLNLREVMMANVHLISVSEVGDYGDGHVEKDSVPAGVRKVTYVERVDLTKKARTTLRKRVLSMPDITCPVYAHGLGNPKTRGELNDALAHYERTTKAARKSNASGGQGKHDDPNYKEYHNAYWDGFTIRHGFIYDQCMAHGGGAGVAMYEGAHLANCIITDNWSGAFCMKGGGMFVDGSDAVIENCFILNNTSTIGSLASTAAQKEQEFAGGLFLYEGTCFNSLIANNYANGFGGGLGLCVGKFYNNTVAYNEGNHTNDKSGGKKVGGVRIATGADPAILMANCIIYGNNGLAIDMTESSDYAPFLHCYVQSQDAIVKTSITHAIYAHKTEGDKNYGIENTFWNGYSEADVAKTPFAADIDKNGAYTPGAKANNDFSLRQADGVNCINGGTEDFLGAIEMAIAMAESSGNTSVGKNKTVYHEAVDGVKLPKTDVVFANRVQDCKVDIGAYEFDGAVEIQPTLYPDKKQAVYYVTQNGYGSATAKNPENAACYLKLQKVLDAAGRWRYASYKYADATDPTQKHNNVTKTMLENELKEALPTATPAEIAAHLDTLKDYDVIVKLEGDSLHSFTYGPTRSTILNSGNENVLQYSLMVPHGIRVEGGYDVTFGLDPENPKPRDILGYPSYFDGIVGSAGGKAYHVVTFTNTLYTEKEVPFTTTEGKNIENQLEFLSLVDSVGQYTVARFPWIENGYTDDVLEKSIPGYIPMTEEEKTKAVEQYWRDSIPNYSSLSDGDKADAIEAYCDSAIVGYKDLDDEDEVAKASAKETFFNSEISGYRDLEEEEKPGALADKRQEIVDKFNKEYPNAWVDKQRAVLDGLFIINGHANGSEAAQQNGAAAIVTSYAHIRNCVIEDNIALGCGGGLYLDTLALVSGCIIKNNSAKYGGGIYVYEPDNLVSLGAIDDPTKAPFAHIISTTISGNDASVSAGGLYFATNVRANSIVVWSNNANQNPNVAGTDATGKTQLVENYPLNYSGVESRRMAGVNNIELPAADSAGVRWSGTMPYEFVGEGDGANGQTFFPITLASVLTRTGMSYSAYTDYLKKYPTLETTDIFGLNRMAQTVEDDSLTLADDSKFPKEIKNNIFIEMGARVLNANFEVKLNSKYIMRRLFVTTTERLPTKEAVALQSNTADNEWKLRHSGVEPNASDKTSAGYLAIQDTVEMYKQMGSTFRNPFLRLGDALDYIIRVRKSDEVMNPLSEDKTTVGDYYKDQRFEIFVCGGTFYPFRDAYGAQVESRANTFLVPEEVTIVGGIKHEADGRSYCQEGHPADTTLSGEPNFHDSISVAGFKLYGASTYDIRTAREHQDRNGNNVNEPWELEEQTILSGVAVQNDAKANVYHVITCLSNEDQIGKLPTRLKTDNPTVASDTLSAVYDLGLTPTQGELLANLEAETQKSKDARTIIIDGVTITGGYANQIDVKEKEKNGQTLTYFRGGGILVEGNWDDKFDLKSDLPEVLGVAKRDIPVMITSCLIKDNLAGNGGGVYTNGTFYAFGCHFTANRSIGPITTDDQDFIPWAAGGAIANNYLLFVCNTLFDNNEAMRGLDITKTIVYNANKRQGYAGAISCSETGLLRIGNCDFVRNKAVAFPAIYNFLDNNLRSVSSLVPKEDRETSKDYYGAGWHFALNTLFWGNKATSTEDSISYANPVGIRYYTHGELDPGNDRRRPWHVANFGPLLDVATLTFCAYEEGTGRVGTVWEGNHDRAKAAPVKPKTYYPGTDKEYTLDGLTRLYAGDFNDVLEDYFGYYPDGSPSTPFCKVHDLGGGKTEYLPCAPGASGAKIMQIDGNLVEPTPKQIASAIAYNYNLIIASENTAPNGPFFVQPSLSAGYDGYMETSSWLVSRLNKTIDTGWGYLKQTVTQTDETNGLYDTKLQKLATDKNDKPIKDGAGNEILVPVGYYLYAHEEGTGVGAKMVPDSVANRFKADKVIKGSGAEPTVDSIYGKKDTVLIPIDKKIKLEDGQELWGEGTYTWVPVSSYDKTGDDGELYTHTIYRKQWNMTDSIIDSDAGLEEQYHDLYGEGMYNLHSKAVHLRFHDIGYPNLLPIGDDLYMAYTHEGETKSNNMRRISTHPKIGIQDVFIDMGIYEYQYVQLLTAGDETDVLWVGPKESGNGTGSSCANATSNLQEAIETLLRSRNDHDKMIKLIEGTYNPEPTTNSSNKAFYIEVPSRTDGITLPKTLNADQTHTVKSLTIRGGYPADIPDNLSDGEDRRDFEQHPVVFEMHEDVGNSTQSLAHLFIIEDAEEKGCFMNYLTNTNKDFRDVVMPVVLEGITFINPYGSDGESDGAAILYKEQNVIEEESQGSDIYNPTNHLLKAVTYTDAESNTVAVPKLIIKDCVFKTNGTDSTVAAVKINKGGGPALIVNSLFHSNAGNPIEAVNTKVVNCTFALNGGHIKLTNEREEYFNKTTSAFDLYADYPSGLYNSIIWKDDQAHAADADKKMWEGDISIGTGVPDGGEDDDIEMKYNAFTQWWHNPDNDKWEFWVPKGYNIIYGTQNIRLSPENTDVFYGPNFIEPIDTIPITAIADSTRRKRMLARDFHLNPSGRVLNCASAELYKSLVPFYAERRTQQQITYADTAVTYYFHSVQRHAVPVTISSTTYYPGALTDKQLKGKQENSDSELTSLPVEYPYSWSSATQERWAKQDGRYQNEDTLIATERRIAYNEKDLALKRDMFRWDGDGIERGAYECSATMQRVLYVQDGATGKGDGTSWTNAFSKENLQRAIDVASIFSKVGGQRAYVFVKSDKYKDVKIRDGVSVFGGIAKSFNDTAVVNEDGYTDDNVYKYINLVCAKREPIVSPLATISSITGLHSDNVVTPNLGFMMDGFKFTNPDSVLTASPVVLDKAGTLLKNVLITDNNMSPSTDLALVQLKDGVLYNSLLFGNTADTIVSVADGSTHTGVLNCTVIADHAGEKTVTSAVAGSVYNTITVNEKDKSLGRSTDEGGTIYKYCNTAVDGVFAPYLDTLNDYTLPTYLTSHRPYHYQLKETSDCINAGEAEATVMVTPVFSPYDSLIHYTNVTASAGPPVVYAFAGDRDPLGNPRQLGGTPDIGCFETWKVTDNSSATNDVTDEIYFSDHYGGHHYPHLGSVLYVMEGANLVIDGNFTTDSVCPGYVLVKAGGSIYGQGNKLRFNYVSAEKPFTSGAGYGLVSMPFDCKLEATASPVPFNAYTYDVTGRSVYSYEFRGDNSDLWKTDLSGIKEGGLIKRTYGWLLEFKNGEGTPTTLDADQTLRFTGWGADANSFVYQEEAGETSKTVTLSQNDLRPTDGSAQFTRAEDMGWNLRGMPYLVSEYETYHEDDYTYDMHIPHILYKMNSADGSYVKNSTTYAVQSWTSGEPLSLHEGFFLQTATIDKTEDVKFKLPVYSPAVPPLLAPLLLMRDMDGNGDLVRVEPNEDAPKTVNYSLGRDGIKWLMNDMPQLFMLSAAKSRLSLLGAAPTEVDIPLGVVIPSEPLSTSLNPSEPSSEARTFTFSLPEPEAFDPYEYVWLIDRGANHVTNLREQDYTTTVEPGTDHSRFRLRIGGVPMGTTDRREYIVFSYKQQLFIRGLMEGDIIRIYSAGGQLILNTVATAEEFTTTLPQTGGIYAVQVNDFSKKVRNL